MRPDPLQVWCHGFASRLNHAHALPTTCTAGEKDVAVVAPDFIKPDLGTIRNFCHLVENHDFMVESTIRASAKPVNLRCLTLCNVTG